MRSINKYGAALAVVLMVFAGFSATASAQRRNEKDVRDAIRSAQSKLDDFEIDLHYQLLSTSSANRNVDEAADLIRELHNQIRVFQENFDRKRENRDDVNRMLEGARRIEDYLRTNAQNRRVTDDWTGVRRQIDRIASNYGVNPNTDNDDLSQNAGDQNDINPTPTPNVRTQPNTRSSRPVYQTPPVYQAPATQSGLRGTYTLDRGQSENIEEILNETRVAGTQKDDLRSKLESPEQVALEVRGNQVTLATSTAEPMTFVADGRDKTEKDAAGRNVRTRATLNGDTLIVSSLGGETDYTITFRSEGRNLKVSRRITTDYLSQTVFAESTYTKTDSVARLGIDQGGSSTIATNTGGNTDPNGGYSDNDNPTGVSNGGGSTRYPQNPDPRTGYPNPPNRTGGRPTAVTTKPGNYTVPNGIVLTGVLENEINTRASQSGDRFRMTVDTPDWRGAVIEGYISGVKSSGKVTGQAAVTFNFERITYNGQTYDFAGSLRDVRDSLGKTMRVDNESTVIGDSQTQQTAKRGGLGAGIGAVIGAIAGGAHGAVVGAVIGSGAGAGSVYAQGKDDIRLMRGTSITVISTSPTSVSGPR